MDNIFNKKILALVNLLKKEGPNYVQSLFFKRNRTVYATNNFILAKHKSTNPEVPRESLNYDILKPSTEILTQDLLINAEDLKRLSFPEVPQSNELALAQSSFAIKSSDANIVELKTFSERGEKGSVKISKEIELFDVQNDYPKVDQIMPTSAELENSPYIPMQVGTLEKAIKIAKKMYGREAYMTLSFVEKDAKKFGVIRVGYEDDNLTLLVTQVAEDPENVGKYNGIVTFED